MTAQRALFFLLLAVVWGLIAIAILIGALGQ